MLLFAFLQLSAAQDDGIELFERVPGDYNYVDLRRLMNLEPPNPFFIQLVCPKRLEVRKTSSFNTFKLKVITNESADTECLIPGGDQVSTTFEHINPNPNSSAPDSETVSLIDINNFYPLLVGKFTDHPVICPLLNSTSTSTQVVCQDTGYLHTFLNHYEEFGTPLGEVFNETTGSTMSALRRKYSVNMAIDIESGYGCSYMRADEEKELRRRVNNILNPSPTPSPASKPLVTPRSSPSSTVNSNSSGESACFPSAAKVQLASGLVIPIGKLRVGDAVVDSAGSITDVIMFTHQDPDTESEFVKVQAEGASIVLSPSHFIYASGSLIPAANVQIGMDILTLGPGMKRSRRSVVSNVERVSEVGLFNPQTVSGDIVIIWDGDAVVASTYTLAIKPAAAHALLAPLRWLRDKAGVSVGALSRAFVKGAPSYMSFGVSYFSEGS